MKKHLINNAIALVVHALIAEISVFVLFIPILHSSFVDTAKILTVVLFFAYIICGFFLMPVKKFSFLSVAGLPVIIGIILFFLLNEGGEIIMFYLYVNPISSFAYYIPNNWERVLLWISSVFPSLLMYLGMLIRKWVGAASAKKTASQP